MKFLLVTLLLGGCAQPIFILREVNGTEWVCQRFTLGEGIQCSQVKK
jgi:hypothetical protein